MNKKRRALAHEATHWLRVLIIAFAIATILAA